MARAILAFLLASMCLVAVAPHAAAVETLSFGVEDGAVRSVSPDGRLFAATFPLPHDAGSTGAPVRALQDDGTPEADPDAPRLCIYAVATADEISCTDFTDFEGWGNGAIAEDMSWSADGATIAFANPRAVQLFQDSDVWTIDTADGTLTNVTDDGFVGDIPIGRDIPAGDPVLVDFLPSLSPDGGQIAFARWTIESGNPGTFQIAALDRASGTTTVVTDLAESALPVGPILWTADGARLVYSIVDRENDAGVWTVDLDGGSPVHVGGGTEDLGEPILLSIDDTGTFGLAIYRDKFARTLEAPYYATIDLATGVATPISPAIQFGDNGRGLYMVALSPTGDALAISQVTPDSDPDVSVFGTSSIDGAEQAIVMTDGPDIAYRGSFGGMTWTSNGGIVLPAPDASEGTPWTMVYLDVLPDDPGPSGDGHIAVVNDDGVILRAAPNRDATPVLTLERGAELEVTGDAVEADGLTWWPVRDPETLTVGYVRADLVDLQE